MSYQRALPAVRLIGPAAARAVAEAFEAGAEWVRQHPGAHPACLHHAATAYLEHLAASKLSVKVASVGEVWERLVSRDGACCWYCGRPLILETATAEHLVPVSQGGTNHLHNLVLACHPCNQANGAHPVALKVRHRERHHRTLAAAHRLTREAATLEKGAAA